MFSLLRSQKKYKQPKELIQFHRSILIHILSLPHSVVPPKSKVKVRISTREVQRGTMDKLVDAVNKDDVQGVMELVREGKVFAVKAAWEVIRRNKPRIFRELFTEPKFGLTKVTAFLHSRSTRPSPEILRIMVQGGIDIESTVPSETSPCGRYGIRPIHWECNETGRMDSVRILVEAGCDVNAQGPHFQNRERPLARAIRYGRSDVVEYLCQQKSISPVVHASKTTALHAVRMMQTHPESLSPERAYEIAEIFKKPKTKKFCKVCAKSGACADHRMG